MIKTVIYITFAGRMHTIYATHDGCFIFHPVEFEFGQTMTNQRVFLRRESVIDGTDGRTNDIVLAHFNYLALMCGPRVCQ